MVGQYLSIGNWKDISIRIKNRFENITFNLKVPIEMAGVNLYINQYNGTNYFEIRSVRVTQNNYLN